jgi:hypothetical protein
MQHTELFFRTYAAYRTQTACPCFVSICCHVSIQVQELINQSDRQLIGFLGLDSVCSDGYAACQVIEYIRATSATEVDPGQFKNRNRITY